MGVADVDGALAPPSDKDKDKDKGGANESASLSLLRHLAERRAHDHAVDALGVLAVMAKKPELDQLRQHAKARGKFDINRLSVLDGIDASLRTPLVELITRLADHAVGAVKTLLQTRV